jgi:hypothetical protein
MRKEGGRDGMGEIKGPRQGPKDGRTEGREKRRWGKGDEGRKVKERR